MKAATSELPAGRAARLHAALLPWFEAVRRDLPWRRTKDPYAIWVSEIMLQQTRVETVIPYFDRFLRELPTVSALAEAPSDKVMSLWSGLGYYRRARMMHEAAQAIARTDAGALPRTAAGLREVRGIGRYTAGAVASIAFGERAALVDGNVARVLARLFAMEVHVKAGAGLERVWALAEALVPPGAAGEWNQALMELGATTCIPRNPRCLVCPVRDACEARAKGLETTLPIVAVKKKPRAAEKVALVGTLKGAVLLARRSRGGLFGGLWEPPVLDADGGDAGASKAFGSLLGIRLGKVEFSGTVTHVLSHRRLEARVLTANLLRKPKGLFGADVPYEALELVRPETFADLGMSTFARKVLAVGGVPTE